MKPKRYWSLILMTSVGAGFLALAHNKSETRKTARYSSRQAVQCPDDSLIVMGRLDPLITTAINARNPEFFVPLNAPVQQGETIGVATLQFAPENMEYARRELADAASSVSEAQESLRQIREELRDRRAQLRSMEAQEGAAETAMLQPEQEVQRREALLRLGLTSEFDFGTAARTRDSASDALASLRSSIAASSVETDQWKAKLAEVRALVAEATIRRDAAEAVAERMQESGAAGPVVSPADGILAESVEPARTSFGIATDPGRLCASIKVRQADLWDIRVGQPALVVLDHNPEVTLHARVSGISETPVDSPEGVFYLVALSVENPEGTWLAGVPMHARLERSSR